MLQTVKYFHMQIRLHVTSRMNTPCLTQERLTIREVRRWNRVIIKIRSQAELVGECIWVEEICLIAMLIYYASTGLFCFAFLIARNSYVGWLAVVFFMALFSAFRTILKISRAVRITKEVRFKIFIFRL
jgi:hypothetical protein